MAAMFDLAIGCTPMLLDPQRKSATQQLSITFQRPTLGNRVWCEAFLQHAGKSTLSCAAEIIDEWGVVCARATGLVKLGRGSWSGGHPGFF